MNVSQHLSDKKCNTEITDFINHVQQNATDSDRPLVFWVDLFCGAGGTSTGIHLAGYNNMYVAACVNHDTNAINSHKANHPETLHFTEDIRDFRVVEKIKALIDQLREVFPGCVVNLWASLECTNFSNAKGGMARDADSRSLADHMPMYLEALQPDYFWVENVREFMAWGPLDENGKPISRTAGTDYLRWMDLIRSFGYRSDAKILNAADYGSCQIRKRLFIQFAKPNLSIKWPPQTHTKDPNKNSLFPLPEWRPVREVLDLEDEGTSIFDRKKPLSDKTLNVIIKGIVKAIEENEDVFLYKYYGSGDNYNSINKPAGTVTTKDRFAKVTMIFNQYKTGYFTDIDRTVGSLTTVPKQKLVSFIMNPSHGGHTTSIDRPCPTVIARQDKAPLYIIHALMDMYGIVDIKMRMLKIVELKRIQGFPDDYVLIGNQSEQKKQLGNAVDVFMSTAISETNYEGITQNIAA